MKVTILGSGTSTGVPMVGCRCNVCRSTDQRDKRTRASLLIENNDRYILVDTSTDLRTQALREGIPTVDAVLFTHSHADHVHGIDDLRGFNFMHRKIIPCFAAAETLASIDSKFSYIFTGKSSHGYYQLLEPTVVSTQFSLFGINITPIPLLHGSMSATGFRFGNLAYLTDCSSIPEESLQLLQGLDVLIIDALRHTPHPHHFNIAGAIEAAAVIGATSTYLTHLTHEISHVDENELPRGIYFAYDGLRFEL
jgi:phosphoribosyl 1,2-cyclic phosphate phosphodiesterase